MSVTHLSAPYPDDGGPRHPKNPVDELALHPHASYSDKPKGPLNYVLVHDRPANLQRLPDDKRIRSGNEWQEHFERMVDSVRQVGVLQPVIAVREGEAMRLLDGQTRVDAAMLAGADTIPILLYECSLTESQLSIAKLTANAQRRGHTDIELASIYVELMALNGWNQAQLCKAISGKPSRISKVLSISKQLSPEVQAMVLDGKLSPRAAYALSRLPDVQVQLNLAKKMLEGTYSVEGLESHIRTLLNGGKREKRPKAVKISYGGMVALIKGDVFAVWESFKAKMDDTIKKLKRDDLPPDMVGVLIR
jgi:ParB/RepB/Spo0J family partition protein